MDARRLDPDAFQAPHEEQGRLTRLANHRLAMMRLESGAVTVRKEWYLLEEVIESALNHVEDRLRNRPVTVRLRPDFLLVELDAVLIERILISLLENAAKHTPPETPIDIVMSQGNGVVQIEVADRGPGLPLGEEQQALERSYRGHPETSQDAGSGLAICRAIVEAHGGTIRAENRPWGGARFRFTVPAKDQPPETPKDA
jgi:two-component system sensor histidine kinase KdpD